MKNFMILTESINFIEANLCEPITREEIAEHSHASLSSLEKLYRYALHISIKEYVTKRRITQAAKDIVSNKGNMLEIAMRYQYNSPEVFTRAFRNVWNVNPSEYKKNWRFTGIFPKINYSYEEGEEAYMARKKVDISDAYEYFKQLSGSYVLCFDAIHFSAVNEISHKAGDIALVEFAARLDRAASDDMLVVRIGGDEFAIVTGKYTEAEASEIGDKVVAENGKSIVYEGKEIPLSLRYGMTQIPKSPRYSEFFGEMHKAIEESRLKEE